MSIFNRIGSSKSGPSADSDADDDGSDADDSATTIGDDGPNFMPEKQEELYMVAHNNSVALNDSGVCTDCGTTLSPIKAQRLFASCKNEDCENHLREIEVAAAKRYYERNGHPDGRDPEEELDASRQVSEDSGSALDGLGEAIRGDEE